mmetsp:Transcript_85078/g.214459  ORF Transcript_85078/g.214459 Transcript_85078/m.214459 type:complete len:714 (+) Transcript_85078:102-2243(+)
MAAEPTTRFAHLLQPIRDLSKVWKIEIAEELEKYIEEVSQLLVTNPEDGISQLNFAEAALLIQGSTAIYSRKVELLYQLVYQALDLLALDKGKDAGKKGNKIVQTGLWAPIPETDELLTIDHLIKEGRNIMLDHAAPESRQAVQRRVPLFLMPRDQADRRKHEFRISSCTVHHTGVYLLQESDARLLDDIMDTQGLSQGDTSLDAPLVPAPPREVQDLDDRLQELLRELPEQPLAPGEDAPRSPAPKGDDMMGKETPTKLKTPFTAHKGLTLAGMDPSKRGLLAAPDPWALLDEHESMGQEVPLEVGKTSKRVNAKKLLMGAEGLPDLDSCQGLPDAELWSPTSTSAAGLAPMLAAGHPVESLFLAAAGHLKSGGKYETQRAGFSAAWLEFEDLFAQATSRKRQLKAAMKRPGAPATPHASDDEAASDHEMPPPGHGIGATPQKLATPAKGMDCGLTPLPDATDEQRKEVARLETMIQDAQATYEATVREHLQALQKDGEGADKRFPQLYANVKRWQDQLEPVLKEFESRPEFDIHEYSTKFLDKMSNIQSSSKDGADGERTIKFARLVHGQPRWEICRRFLTCLILTNTGNTDIIFNSEEERLNDFSLKLLKAEKKWISLEGEEEAAPAKKTAKGSRKSKAIADSTAAAGSSDAREEAAAPPEKATKGSRKTKGGAASAAAAAAASADAEAQAAEEAAAAPATRKRQKTSRA